MEYFDFLLNSKEYVKGIRPTIVLTVEFVALLISIGVGVFVWIISLGAWKDGLFAAFLGLVFSQAYILIKSKFRPVYYFGIKTFEKRLNNISEKEKNTLALSRKLFIDEQYIQFESPESFHRWNWASISQITLSTNLIIFHANSTNVLLVPKRVFHSEEEFSNFYNWILKCRELAISVENT